MLKEKNKVILIFVGCYLPGFRGGGPIKTISNLTASLGDHFDFKIITSDRDLGSKQPYDNIIVNDWNKVGKADVYYLSKNFSLSDLKILINSIQYDCLYLNSFFSLNFTIKPLLLRKFNMINNTPVLLAPRGEFSQGALEIKSIKKGIFFFFARLFSLYSEIIWHASTSAEKEDIKKSLSNNMKSREINVQIAVQVASDISIQADEKLSEYRQEEYLKICFLSRISPMKNLDYALDILKAVKTDVVFDIFGPKESLEYWELCAKKIEGMPPNIKVFYKGEVSNHLVRGIFSTYDILFVPTRGENFGHVFAEALSVGLPILLSDQTPWRRLESFNAGWDLPLDRPEKFVEIIEDFSKKSLEHRIQHRCGAKKFYKSQCENSKIIDDNIAILEYVINSNFIEKKH